MRLLLLSDAPNIHTRRWCAYFAARGHDVHVASCERATDLAGTFHPLPSAPVPGALRYPLAAHALRGVIARVRPDVVNAHFVPNYGVMAALAGADPLAVTAWGSDILLNARRTPLHRARAQWALRRAALVISDAAVLTDAVMELGVPRARTLTMPLGVDTEMFAPRAHDPAAPLLVASTRRLEHVYDVATVLSAVATLARARAFRVALAGDGSLRPLLQRSVEADALGARLTFHGMMDERAVAALLAEADVYVSASLSDSTSVSLLEAMSSGAFPVVSDIPANREWITDGETGLLFPCGDADNLARQLGRALDDARLRARAAERNRTLVRERASRDACMGAIERALLGLVRS